jgi:peptide/nickel transport system permease protein
MFRVVRIFFRDKLAAISLLILLFFTLVALLAPVISPYAPNESHTNPEDKLAPPNQQYILGTDQLGRDVLSRIFWGSRTSLGIAYSTAIGVLLLGLPLGFISGYFGGVLDNLLMRLVDIFLVIPPFILILILVAIFGSSQWILVLVLSITMWPFIARIARAEALSHRTREYNLISRALGASDFHILFHHIIPNCLFPVVAGMALIIADIILSEAALGYLGVGDPSVISWGRMLSDAQKYMYFSWTLPIFPGVAISLVIFAFNMVGGGLNEVLNKGRSRS